MKGIGRVAGLGTLLCMASIAPTAASTGQAPPAELVNALRAQDCLAVPALAERRISENARIGSRQTDQILIEMAAYCAYQANDEQRAYQFTRIANRLPDASHLAWAFSLWWEAMHGTGSAGLDTLTRMSRERPDFFNGLYQSTLNGLDARFEKEGLVAERLSLLKILSTYFVPTDLFQSADEFRVRYAGLLVEQGDPAQARATLARLTEPVWFLQASLDPRLRTLMPANLDLRGRVEADLLRAQAAQRAHPRQLAPLLWMAANLRMLGRFDEALATLLSAQQDESGPATYEDAQDKLNWWWDSLAKTHYLLGHESDMVAAYTRAANIGEGGGANISQVLNLAGRQLSLGHARIALDMLAPFDVSSPDVSPYGQIVARSIRGCAAYLLGRTEEAQADLAYLIAHRDDGPGGIVEEVHLCMDDPDRAASDYIALLGDPRKQADARLSLAETDPMPAHLQADPMTRRLSELRARPDVQAALERAGGVPRIPLMRTDF